MQDPGSASDVMRHMRTVAPITESDAEALHQLLSGVKAAADRMNELAPVFPGEVDTSQMSTTVEGGE